MINILFDFSGAELTEEEEKIIENAARQVLKDENHTFDAEISVVVTNDEEIREINRKYRDKDVSTDVLSFPQFEFMKPSVFDKNELHDALLYGDVVLGDIVLSMETICRHAEEYGHSNKRELTYMIIHSMLHLLGYDHMKQEDKNLMREKEKRTLESLGILE